MKRLNDLLSGKEKIKVAEITANNLTLPFLSANYELYQIQFGNNDMDIDVNFAEYIYLNKIIFLHWFLHF